MMDCSVMMGMLIKFPCKEENVIESAGTKMLEKKLGNDNVEEYEEINVSTENIKTTTKKKTVLVDDKKYCQKYCSVM